MSEQTTKPSPVDRLFSRLQLAYGRKWLSMWDGIDDPGTVKEEWSRRLAPFATREGADAIAWVLDHKLPADWPPTPLEFAALVRAAMPAQPEVLALPEERKADPERARAILARLQTARPAPRPTVEVLQERAAAGQKLGFLQRQILREQLARQAAREALSTPTEGAAA